MAAQTPSRRFSFMSPPAAALLCWIGLTAFQTPQAAAQSAFVSEGPSTVEFAPGSLDLNSKARETVAAYFKRREIQEPVCGTMIRGFTAEAGKSVNDDETRRLRVQAVAAELARLGMDKDCIAVNPNESVLTLAGQNLDLQGSPEQYVQISASGDPRNGTKLLSDMRPKAPMARATARKALEERLKVETSCMLGETNRKGDSPVLCPSYSWADRAPVVFIGTQNKGQKARISFLWLDTTLSSAADRRQVEIIARSFMATYGEKNPDAAIRTYFSDAETTLFIGESRDEDHLIDIDVRDKGNGIAREITVNLQS